MSEKESVTTAIAKLDPFHIMDLLDEQAFLEELKGRIGDKWVYSFYQDGEKKTGLSKIGVDACCREMAKAGEVIRELDVTWEVDPTDDNHVLFKGFAVRVAISKDGKEYELDKVVGTKRQCLFQVTKTGMTSRRNIHWFEHGAMKALRNARARLISEEIIAKVMAIAKEQGRVKDVPAETKPPPVVTEAVAESPQPIESVDKTSDKTSDEIGNETEASETSKISSQVREWANYLFPGKENKKKQNRLIRAMGTEFNEAGELVSRPDLRTISDKQLEEIYTRAQNVVTPEDAEKVLVLGSYQVWLDEQEDLPF